MINRMLVYYFPLMLSSIKDPLSVILKNNHEFVSIVKEDYQENFFWKTLTCTLTQFNLAWWATRHK